MPMARNPANQRHCTTVRLPGDLLDELDRVATDRVLGRNKLIELLLRAALDQLAPPPARTRGASPTQPPEQVGTCPRCGRQAAVVLYDRNRPAPWWYMVEHEPPAGTVDQATGDHIVGFCPGGGYPAVEQERPA